MRRVGLLAGAVPLVAATAWAVLRLVGVTIAPGGDYGLTVTTSGSVATLVPGAVTHFTLSTDASAGGHKITNEAAGFQGGDGLVYGQAVGGPDFTGTYPALSLVVPLAFRAAGSLPTEALGQGACDETTFTVAGAVAGMVASVNTSPVADTVLVARVTAPDTIAVRVCALQAAVLNGEDVEVAVVP